MNATRCLPNVLLCSLLCTVTGCGDKQTEEKPPVPPAPAPVPVTPTINPPPSAAVTLPKLEPKPPATPEKPAVKLVPDMSDDNTLFLHYHSDTETSYTDIKLEHSILTYTTFVDHDNRCAQWVQSRPCWADSDLKTRSTKLANEDVDNLYAVVGESKIFDIDADTLGGAKKDQRYYAQRLEIHMGGIEKHITYQSFPNATPKPEAFERMETALLAYARDLPEQ